MYLSVSSSSQHIDARSHPAGDNTKIVLIYVTSMGQFLKIGANFLGNRAGLNMAEETLKVSTG